MPKIDSGKPLQNPATPLVSESAPQQPESRTSSGRTVKSQPGTSYLSKSESTKAFLKSLPHARAVASLPKGSVSRQIPPKSAKPSASSGSSLEMYIYDGHASFELHQNGKKELASGLSPRTLLNTFNGPGVLDYESFLAETLEGGWPHLSVDLTSEQADHVKGNFSLLEADCTKGGPSCRYHVSSHNCAELVQDAYRWAGKKGHWLSHISPEQMARLAKKINQLTAEYQAICNEISHNPAVILGEDVRGSIDKTRTSIWTVLDFLKTFEPPTV